MRRRDLTFRVFVSSTFSDLVAERNALQKHVFPRLRKLCQKNGARFQAIDLRWGVREEAAIDQLTMKICLEEIARCQRVTPRPNFIVLLGDRYGWQPLPWEIPAQEFEGIRVMGADDKALLERWYRRDDNAVPAVYCLQPLEGEFINVDRWEIVERRLRSILIQSTAGMKLIEDDQFKYTASATEQEIVAGALAKKICDAHEHVFGFFRQITNLNDLIREVPQKKKAKDFVDLDDSGAPDEKAHARLNDLKERLNRSLPGNVHEYKVKWTGDGLTTDHIPRLCDDVLKSLSRIIEERIERMQNVDPLDKEIADHETFGQKCARFFTGRAGVLQTIGDYVIRDDRHPLAVYGASGSGKSALMARAIAECGLSVGRKGLRIADCVIVSRFIGATPDSSDGRALLESLCREISRRYGADETTAPMDYEELIQEFPKRLALAKAGKPLIVFLDGLDQLSNADNARNLTWLPAELPPHVRLIVSMLPGECLSALERKQPRSSLVELEPMSAAEGSDLLDLWLKDAGRTLIHEQRAEVLGKFALNGLPLYLKLAFEEASRWKSYSLSIRLSTDIPGMVRQLFRRLSADHGQMMISHSLGYLAAAKNGLTEDEMLDVLSLDEDVFKDFMKRARHEPPEQRLPVVVWSRLYFDLEPYLTERSADGASLMAFYHRQLGGVVAEEYLAGKVKQERHRGLARYLEDQPLQIEKEGKKTPNVRKLSELPFQQIHGQMWQSLQQTLCSLEFVAAKCGEEMAFDLLRDYDLAIESKDLPLVAQMRNAITLALPGIVSRPSSAMQAVYNRLRWFEGLVPELLGHLSVARLRLDEQPFWISAEAPLPGARVSGPVSFPFEIASGIQSVAHPSQAIAIGSLSGEVVIHYLASGELLGTRRLTPPRVVGIALSEDASSLAYIDLDGGIRSELGKAFLQGRKNEKLILNLSAHGVIAVRYDDALVAWQPDRNEAVVIAEALPRPLIVLRSSVDSQHILYVAGYNNQMIGVVSWSGGQWINKMLTYAGPSVQEADLDSEGEHLLLASMDRRMSVWKLGTDKSLTELSYERHADVHLVGSPAGCAFGAGDTSEWVFFGTDEGHIGCWNWRTGTVERLEDYAGGDERTGLVRFECSASGDLFLSTVNEWKILTREHRHQPLSQHRGAVSGCFITNSEKVVSWSKRDKTVKWHSADGLQMLLEQHHQNPTVVARLSDTDDVVIGNEGGAVWIQPFGAKIVEADKIRRFFLEPIVSLFAADDGSVLAAARSGKVLRIDLASGSYQPFSGGTGMQIQKRILPTGKNDVVWSMSEQYESTGTLKTVSQIHSRKKKKVIFSGSFRDFTVSRDGMTLCLIDEAVKILRRGFFGWKVRHHRDMAVKGAEFLYEDELIAVVLEEAPWLEIWKITDGLPTLAAVDLPRSASCLSTIGSRIVVGSHSGDLLSFRLKIGC
jgi:hypothetical protein